MNITDHKRVQEYLNAITRHVKNKKAHTHIQQELLTHVEDLIEEYIKDGYGLEQAIDQALLQTGSTEQIGKQFHKTYELKLDWQLLGLIVLFMGLGLALMFSVDQVLSTNTQNLFMNKVVAACLGIAVLIGLVYFNYKKLQRISYLMFFVNQLITLFVLIDGETLMGKPYLRLGFLQLDYIATISPIVSILAVAGILAGLNYTTKKSWFIIIGLYLLPVWLLLMTSGFFSIILFSVAFVFLLFRLPINRKVLLTGLGTALGVLIFILSFWLPDYIHMRIFSFLYYQNDPMGSGYVYYASKTIIENAGWWGQWFQNNSQLSLLPAAHTNFIFSYLVYQLGWVLAGVFILLSLYFMWRMTHLASYVTDLFGSLLMSAVISVFCVQIIWSIGMTIGVLPFISVSLPLISHGGTHFILSMLLLGLLLGVYRQKSYSQINNPI
ncbi:FtsW/RodA/SpoVE family cell cycle protein [Bacillus horti]|uniref:Cell division protein FtsW (Lipid II flippase) n=1 Tax=Caldalkalibacillus horti TaxID=77523 RepID=A0ABT9W529_9BACI|nr:FtsW/RodA/SpoVE family cell cycle protein [Bacillus horti]MDQ0168341.1 cell division protein FtsW (lipid II flippase) [Bacillus horti]